TLYALARAYLGAIRLVVLINAWESADVVIPLHANPRLPTLALNHLPNGLRLVNDLDPDDQPLVVDGSVRVCVPGKTGAVYRAILADESTPAPREGKGASYVRSVLR